MNRIIKNRITNFIANNTFLGIITSPLLLVLNRSNIENGGSVQLTAHETTFSLCSKSAHFKNFKNFVSQSMKDFHESTLSFISLIALVVFLMSGFELGIVFSNALYQLSPKNPTNITITTKITSKANPIKGSNPFTSTQSHHIRYLVEAIL